MAKRDDFIDREPGTSDFGLIVRLVTPTTPIPVTPSGGTPPEVTSGISSVSASASSVTLLSANTLRSGASIYNDSSAILYIACTNAAASTTAFSYKAMPEAYFEVPSGYTGEIRGIWASATGAARITEYEVSP